jgi:hypothetical protein
MHRLIFPEQMKRLTLMNDFCDSSKKSQLKKTVIIPKLALDSSLTFSALDTHKKS